MLTDQLYKAILNDDIGAVKMLLYNNLNPNIFDSEDMFGYSPLMRAIVRQNEEMIDLLLDYDADPLYITDAGWTTLMLACKYKNLNIVKKIHKYVRNLEHTSIHGQTALFIACYNNNTDIIKYLLEQGANPNHKNKAGSVPLDYYISGYIKDMAIVKLLILYGATL